MSFHATCFLLLRFQCLKRPYSKNNANITNVPDIDKDDVAMMYSGVCDDTGEAANMYGQTPASSTQRLSIQRYPLTMSFLTSISLIPSAIHMRQTLLPIIICTILLCMRSRSGLVNYLSVAKEYIETTSLCCPAVVWEAREFRVYYDILYRQQ
jgi:hypothetical protein